MKRGMKETDSWQAELVIYEGIVKELQSDWAAGMETENRSSFFDAKITRNRCGYFDDWAVSSTFPKALSGARICSSESVRFLQNRR